MRNLEILITQVKNRMIYGMETGKIAAELVEGGWHSELVYWAIKAARFELSKESAYA